MDDNVWEYPFGDLDDDEELFVYNLIRVGFPEGRGNGYELEHVYTAH